MKKKLKKTKIAGKTCYIEVNPIEDKKETSLKWWKEHDFKIGKPVKVKLPTKKGDKVFEGFEAKRDKNKRVIVWARGAYRTAWN